MCKTYCRHLDRVLIVLVLMYKIASNVVLNMISESN